MKADRILSAASGFVLRQWWIVLLVVAAAVAAGLAMAPKDSLIYRVEISVNVDSAALARVPGFPGPDRVLGETKTSAFKEALADSVGMEVGQLAGLRTYIVGTPVDRLIVSMDSPDKTTAGRIADAGAALVVETARGLASTEILQRETIALATQEAITALEAIDAKSALDRADIVYKLWELNTDLATSTMMLASYNAGYTYSSQSGVTSQSTSDKRLDLAFGAGFLGLLAGIGVGLAREHWTGRRAG